MKRQFEYLFWAKTLLTKDIALYLLKNLVHKISVLFLLSRQILEFRR